ncbi:MAG: YncE family protein [Nitrososphaera sp.]
MSISKKRLCAIFMMGSAALFLQLGILQHVSAEAVTSNPFRVGVHPFDVAINNNTHKVFVSDLQGYSVFVFDDSAQRVIGNISLLDVSPELKFDYEPTYLAVDPTTNRLYVTYECDCHPSYISVIDGATYKVVDKITIPNLPTGIALNHLTNKIYITYGNNETTVLDGATQKIISNITTQVPISKVAVDMKTNRIYLGTSSSGEVLIADGNSDSVIGTIPLHVGARIADLAVNEKSNLVYALSTSTSAGSGDLPVPSATLSIVDGQSNTVIGKSIPIGSSGGIAIDEAHNRTFISQNYGNSIFTVNQSDNMTTFSNLMVGEKYYPNRLAFSGDSGHLYAVTTGTYVMLSIGSQELPTPEFSSSTSFIVAGVAVTLIVLLRKRL